MPPSLSFKCWTIVHLNFQRIYWDTPTGNKGFRALQQQLKQNQKSPTAEKRRIFQFLSFCSAASNHPEFVDKVNLTTNEKYTEINHVYSTILFHSVFPNLDVTCMHSCDRRAQYLNFVHCMRRSTISCVLNNKNSCKWFQALRC